LSYPSVALALDQNRVTLHGWVYDIETGSIDTLNGGTGRFIPFADNPQYFATPALSDIAA
jgi:carbonic anhydrase